VRKIMSNVSSLFNIVKKWAKTGKLEPKEVIRAGILVADKLNKASKHDHKGKLKRKSFSKTTQEITLIKQADKCNICGKKLDVVNFDHIDGNRSNSLITNCQALCPNCHAKKTRKKGKTK
jgi:5-methylcytosine-specific restriction endonuclease McrA